MQPQSSHEQKPQPPQSSHEQKPPVEKLTTNSAQPEMTNPISAAEQAIPTVSDPTQATKSVATTQTTIDDAAQTTPVHAPATAADDELIEKEWVDAGQKIITDHAKDPKTEETAQHDLGKDYVEKRFGFDIENSEE